MKYLSLPKVQLAIFLSLLIIVKLILNFTLLNLTYFAGVISFTVLVDYLIILLRKVKPYFFAAAMVTGMIISLVSSPNNSLFETAIIIILAITSKHIIKINNRQIFNPAAFGIFFGSLIFSRTISWWAVSSSSLIILGSILISGYVAIFRSRKLEIILVFYLFYNLSVYLLTKQFNFFDPTLIFFTLIMLPEPITSPNKTWLKIIFGLTVGLLTLILSKITLIPDVFLGSLLLTDIIFHLPFKTTPEVTS